jgi:GTP-binding protein
MLGYTNLESEKGFAFFQKFMGERGVYKQLKKEGIQEGDIVRLYGHTFEYLE